MTTSVLAAGCVFPSGPGIGMADVALRTGLALVRRHPFFVDRCGQRVQASYFNDASLKFNASRWAALADACLTDLQSQLDPETSYQLAGRTWRAWVVLPDSARCLDFHRLYEHVEPALAEWPYPLDNVALHPGGHAAGVAALSAAAAACQADPELVALVIAIDSQLDAEALNSLEVRRLLHGAKEMYEGAARANPYGRIPGEGAAAVVLSAKPAGPVWCQLASAVTGHEPRIASQPEPCTGAGLTDTARRAMAAAGLGDAKLHTLTHDATGEPYRADEFGFTALRLARRLAPDYRRITPALASADLGSASAVAHAALTSWQCRQQSDGRARLVLSSSDDALRGAMVFRAPQRVCA